ncbi:hypothetical protein FEAC_19140 [Ferrimicrobium acidiphilum DSM 19497]|uniref:Uncharacterized protein n=1 Tax=Ferrimicrobium acidiphilum DSM 19497 TaxID=1121877 RepID=A0A0D8FTP8_9ACTN|nr:hypothetical protein FEAC_19140 [Ferrimicrobium acidiphilum DSM 19497]
MTENPPVAYCHLDHLCTSAHDTIEIGAHFAHFGHRIRSFRTVSDGEPSGATPNPYLTSFLVTVLGR